MSRKYVMLFGDTHSAVSELNDQAAGRLFKAILRYADCHEEIDLPGEERYVYRMLLAQFARDEEAYRKRSERNKRHRESLNALSEPADASAQQSDTVDACVVQYKDKDEDKDKEEDKDKDKDKEGVTRARMTASASCPPANPTRPGGFTPPTPEEVRSYALEAHLSFDAGRFCDYNASRGWMQGNRPITDWKAAARLWASRGDLPTVGPSPPRSGKVLEQQQYSQREYTNSLDALDRMMERYYAEHPEERPPCP